MVHPHAFAGQQHLEPAPTEPAPRDRQLAQPRAHRAVVRPAAPVADRRPVHADRGARPLLTHPVHLAQVRHSFPPRGRPYLFLRDILQHRVVQRRIRQQLLQTTVLVLQRPKPLGLRHFEPAILGLPVVKRTAADPVLAAQFPRRRACFMLAQDW